MNHFTDLELNTLSAEIDNQLSELANEPAEDISKAAKRGKKTLPSKQKRQLEQATKEDAESFLKNSPAPPNKTCAWMAACCMSSGKNGAIWTMKVC